MPYCSYGAKLLKSFSFSAHCCKLCLTSIARRLYKKETVFTLMQQIKREYPELKVTKYMGGVSRDVLKENDIIVATHKSASTALDIKNLLVCVNIVSFNSQVTAEQMLGRLRKLKDGTTPHLVDMCNVVLHDHQRHARQRCSIYRELGQNLVERTLT